MAVAKKKTKQSTKSIGDAVKILETALLAMKKQKYSKAKDILEKLNKDYSKDLEIRGKILTLIKICDKKMVTEGTPNTAANTEVPEELYDLGIYLHNNREYQEALKCFEKALTKTKTNLDYFYYAMAATEASLDDFPAAAKNLKKAVEISVENLYKAQNDPGFASFREEVEIWNTVALTEDTDNA
jgi:tetratricopeptide (TPR) repeat protein